jgi:hypothetical protein
MPRVVMKGERPILVMNKPLITPTRTPMARPMAAASQMFMCPKKKREPTTTPTRAMTAPTERSMPPLTRDRVMAITTIPLIAKLMNMVRKFSIVRK